MIAWFLVGLLGLVSIWTMILSKNLVSIENDLREYLRRVKFARDTASPALQVHFAAHARVLELIIHEHFADISRVDG